MIWPLNRLVPLASLISTLWGMPGSLLSKSSTNAWPAGASRWSVSKAMFRAEMCSTAPVAAGPLGVLDAGVAAPAAGRGADVVDGLTPMAGIVEGDGTAGAYE